jgi:hypothetical protein
MDKRLLNKIEFPTSTPFLPMTPFLQFSGNPSPKASEREQSFDGGQGLTD